MNVLILDDEPILRQGIIKKITLSNLPLTIVGEAGDGVNGLELIRTKMPDIIITDIRMPGMDGLQFIENALQINEDLHFIIISGYSEFEYAKKALKYGVSDYLLKPVEDEELKASLAKLIIIIEAERNSTVEKAQLIQSQELNKATLRQQYLSQIIQLSEPAAGYDKRDEQLELIRQKYKFYLTIVLTLEPFQLPHNSFRKGEEAVIWFAVENIMSDRMEATGRQGVLFKHVVHSLEMVYLLGVDSPEENIPIKRWLGDVLYGMQQYLKLEVTISMGIIVESMDNIQQSYQQAKLAIRNKMIHGTGKIYEYGINHKQPLDMRSLLSEEDERVLLQWLQEYNLSSFQNWISHRIQSFVQSENSTYSQLEWFCVNLYFMFRKYLLSQTKLTEWLIGEMDDLLRWLQNLTKWQDVVKQMQQQTAHIMKYLAERNNISTLDMMDEVKCFIDSRFQEEITLQVISETFYIHPNYFSRRFKERFGDSFHEYLTSVRMRAAAKWMEESDLKILQIAQMVGFDDAAYFSSVFRKTYGVTPKQYREKHSSDLKNFI